MKKITHEEMIKMTQLNAKREVYENDIRAILKSYIEVIKETVGHGIGVTVPLLGTFYAREKQPVTNRRRRNIHTHEIEVADYPAYNLPAFKPSQSWMEELRTQTWGAPL